MHIKATNRTYNLLTTTIFFDQSVQPSRKGISKVKYSDRSLAWDVDSTDKTFEKSFFRLLVRLYSLRLFNNFSNVTFTL